jgi:hypothetical protein
MVLTYDAYDIKHVACIILLALQVFVFNHDIITVSHLVKYPEKITDLRYSQSHIDMYHTISI